MRYGLRNLYEDSGKPDTVPPADTGGSDVDAQIKKELEAMSLQDQWKLFIELKHKITKTTTILSEKEIKQLAFLILINDLEKNTGTQSKSFYPIKKERYCNYYNVTEPKAETNEVTEKTEILYFPSQIAGGTVESYFECANANQNKINRVTRNAWK